MSIYIKATVRGIVGRAVNIGNGSRIHHDRDYAPFVEACVAAETAELRCKIAELKLANHELKSENSRLKTPQP